MEDTLEKIPVIHPAVEPKEDVSRFNSLAERLDDIGPPQIFEDTSPDIAGTETMHTIDEVQAAVRDSLRFDHRAPLRDLESTGTTNCIGYTIVGSEALEQVGIDHHVGFVNGHAAIFAKIPSEDGEKLHMIDMLNPKINQDVSGSMLLYSEDDEIEVGNENSTRFFGLLDSSKLDLPENKDFISASEDLPWLSVKKCYSANDIKKNSQLFVNLMEPEAGREVLAGYGNFRTAFEEQDYERAAESVITIGGAFPEVDARSDVTKDIKVIVNNLARDGKLETAQNLVEAFFSSHIGTDTRIYEIQGDCYRAMAKKSKEPMFAELAEASYAQSKQVKRKALNGRISGKLAAAQELQVKTA